jgi:hypothetical protein
MRIILGACVSAALVLAACGRAPTPASAPPLTAAMAAQVEDSVRAFMQTVAHDVTQDGPTAWGRHFADSPAFFMAVNGRLVFPTGAAAIAGIPDVARQITHIELVWNGEVRVDPLTPELAIVATPWHEVQVMAAGNRVEESGFFTGVAEYRNGRWQLRDAHWSDAAPAGSGR